MITTESFPLLLPHYHSPTLKDVCKCIGVSQALQKKSASDLKDNEETILAGAIDPAALERRDYQRII